VLFNSYLFIFIFLPLTLFAYFSVCNFSHRVGVYTLILSSLLFYACFDVRYTILVLGSILFNFTISQALARTLGERTSLKRRVYVTLGVCFNLGLLGYYKYTDFFIANVNSLLGSSYALQHIFLPLGISFFTFQQIGYVVDVYNRETIPPHLREYMIFVLFFPHLVAGPIVHNREIIVQFQDHERKTPRWDNLYAGLTLFCVGLFKKVLLADTFAAYVGPGFEAASPHFTQAWTASFAYTMQIYFDFSGYSDMAIGLARMFNIQFPQNFNAPYRALDIQDFWRRWHITLSRFLRQYLYIPLGGNKQGDARTLANLFVTFLLGGIWHGASWCFVAWGVLHGAGIVAHRLWNRQGLRLPRPLAWLATFFFVNFAWVFFRARTWDAALAMLRGMTGQNGFQVPNSFAALGRLPGVIVGGPPLVVDVAVLLVLLLALVEISFRPFQDIVERYLPAGLQPVSYAALFLAATVCTNRISEFIYFQF
jgi:alginate O-acetyltransferase complex protein AlgI